MKNTKNQPDRQSAEQLSMLKPGHHGWASPVSNLPATSATRREFTTPEIKARFGIDSHDCSVGSVYFTEAYLLLHIGRNRWGVCRWHECDIDRACLA